MILFTLLSLQIQLSLVCETEMQRCFKDILDVYLVLLIQKEKRMANDKKDKSNPCDLYTSKNYIVNIILLN